MHQRRRPRAVVPVSLPIRHALPLVVALGVLAVALGAVPAYAADYSYWYGNPTQKVYATTPAPTGAARASAPTATPVEFGAARSEYEGRQLMIRPFGGGVKDVWIEPSELRLVSETTISVIPASEVSVFKVGYVWVSYPSWGYSRKGSEPDPLLPMTLANGQRLGWRPGQSPNLAWRSIKSLTTQPFYLLFRVPENAAPGVYAGTLKVTCTAEDGSPVPAVEVPVRLTVHPFSVAKKTLKTSFGIGLRWARYANSAANAWLSRNPDPGPAATRVPERTTFYGDQINGWLRFMSDHRLSPQGMQPAWETGSDWGPPVDNGDMVARDAYLTDYLGTGSATTFVGQRFDFNTVRMPEYESRPSYITNPFSSATAQAKAAQYYRTMRAELGPYLPKAYVYAIDEPYPSQRDFVERYGAFVHQHAPGVPFMLTTEPGRFDWRPFKNVDIYVNKLHFFYRDLPKWITPIRQSGKKVWMYSHATIYQGQTPMFLIDKPLADSRVQGWFAYHTKADGLLYYSINRWTTGTKNSSTYRDPYKNLVSYISSQDGKPFYANGDGSLVYPGYYPGLGLYVQGSPPVSSLRMEALRDGLEDYEYIKLIAAKKGTTVAGGFVGRIIGKPATVVMSGKPTFPAYSKSPYAYDAAKRDMAATLSQ